MREAAALAQQRCRLSAERPSLFPSKTWTPKLAWLETKGVLLDLGIVRRAIRKFRPMTEKKGGGPSSQGAGNTTGQQGSPHGGKEGKQGGSGPEVGAGSMDDAGDSRDANKPGNKTAKQNERGGG